MGQKVWVILLVWACLGMTVRAQLKTYPEGLHTGLPHNDDYTVRVRMPGGEWQDVFEYKVQVDLDKPQDASMVQFDMGSPVESSSQSLTANRLPVWGSSLRPVQTRWIPLRQSVLNWRRWNRSSRRV